MKHVKTSNFKNYQRLALANTTTLADRLLSLGCDVSGHGSQNHRLVVRIRGIDGNSAKEVLDKIGVACYSYKRTSFWYICDGVLCSTSWKLSPSGRYHLSCSHDCEGT